VVKKNAVAGALENSSAPMSLMASRNWPSRSLVTNG
jgi:hypothetical protein